MQDRFGLGWRKEIAAEILTNLDRIDILEVISDDYCSASKNERRALKTLSNQVPVTLHGVSLGLASTVPVQKKLLENTARLCEEIKPDSWSEHLAFVRGGGIEIGHLTAPPRTQETIEGAIANLNTAQKIVGSLPLVENIATLIEPPASTYDEASWVSEILKNSEAGLLLDLHNLYANAMNFKFDALEFLDSLPLHQIKSIHLAGGRWVEALDEKRLLDDHLHDVPDPVYDLLTEVGARTSQPLTVILERDGKFPAIEILLGQLDRARAALAKGREKNQGYCPQNTRKDA